jgi:type I restriction enzyme S subunit
MKRKGIFTTENTESTEVDSVASVRSVVNTDDLPDGFQMTELGPLPKEWRVARLGEVMQFQTGQREKGGARTDQGIISVGGEHITEDGQIDFISFPKYVSHEFFQNMSTGKVNPGDILVVKDGARTGKSAFVRQVPPTGMAVNEHVFILRAHNQNAVDGEYVGFWFRSQMAWAQINSAYHGLIGGINRREITNFLLPLPPLPEQRAIAHVLRTVQRAKEATEGVIAALKELKKSLMQHLFTYGPVSVTERERVPLQETEIGPLPSHWRVVRLGEVVERPQYGYTASANQEKIGPKLLRITDIQDDTVYWPTVPFCSIGRKDLEKYLLKRGDILVARIGATTGKTYLVNECPLSVFASYLIRLRTTSDLLPEYLYFFTHTSQYWAQINAVKGGRLKQGINIPVLTAVLIPLPPLDEQREIARMLQAVDAKIAAEQARREALEGLFKTLLQELMSGKRRVGCTTENTEDTER